MDFAASAQSEKPGGKSGPGEMPARWRGLVRRSEPGLIILAVAVGVVAAGLVALTAGAVQVIHQICFGLPINARLSGAAQLRSPYLVLVPAIGGAILGFTGIFIRRWRPRRPVDPIEANALHGGRMSLIDSSLIALQTVVSCGFGASVGLEPAIRRSARASGPSSAGYSGCAGATCARWSAAAPPAPLPLLSKRR